MNYLLKHFYMDVDSSKYCLFHMLPLFTPLIGFHLNGINFAPDWFNQQIEMITNGDQIETKASEVGRGQDHYQRVRIERIKLEHPQQTPTPYGSCIKWEDNIHR